MEKKEPALQTPEPGLNEAKKILDYFTSAGLVNTLNVSARDKEIFKMKWKYGLTHKQIAEKLKLSEARIRTLYDRIIYKCYSQIANRIAAPEINDLLKENENLKKEIDLYKKKFDALNTEKKKEFLQLDIVCKNLTDSGLSFSAAYRLERAGIKTVGDLLQYRLSSLLVLRDINTKIIEEIEAFCRKHELKISR